MIMNDVHKIVTIYLLCLMYMIVNYLNKYYWEFYTLSSTGWSTACMACAGASAGLTALLIYFFFLLLASLLSANANGSCRVYKDVVIQLTNYLLNFALFWRFKFEGNGCCLKDMNKCANLGFDINRFRAFTNT